MTVFEGNSGGPVYVFFENRYAAEGFITMHGILGVVQGKLDANLPSESYKEKRIEKANVSLACVIHAAFIRELLEMVP